jgi:hypothetical protein
VLVAPTIVTPTRSCLFVCRSWQPSLRQLLATCTHAPKGFSPRDCERPYGSRKSSPQPHALLFTSGPPYDFATVLFRVEPARPPPHLHLLVDPCLYPIPCRHRRVRFWQPDPAPTQSKHFFGHVLIVALFVFYVDSRIGIRVVVVRKHDVPRPLRL